MIKLKSLFLETYPWEMSSDQRKNYRPYSEKAYREGRPMAFSFSYNAVEPQVREVVSTLHRLGIATAQSAGFSDSLPIMGAIPRTGVYFEQGKISPDTLKRIKIYLEQYSDNVQVKDGDIAFTYKFPENNKKLTTIEAQYPENALPAILIWRGVIKILEQDLPH